jgi:hypothetical protein
MGMSRSGIVHQLRRLCIQFNGSRWVYKTNIQEPTTSDEISGLTQNDQSQSLESQSASSSSLAALFQTSTTEEQNNDQSDGYNWLIELYSGFI